MVTTPVSQFGWTENIRFPLSLFKREQGSHSYNKKKTKNSCRKPWDSHDYSEAWLLLPELVRISCWLWRRRSLQVLLCGAVEVTWPVGEIKTTSPHVCTLEECAWRVCGVTFTTRIVACPGSWAFFSRLFQLGWKKGLSHLAKNQLCRKHVSIPVDDWERRAVWGAQPWRSYATQHIASGKLSRQKEGKPDMKNGKEIPLSSIIQPIKHQKPSS